MREQLSGGVRHLQSGDDEQRIDDHLYGAIFAAANESGDHYRRLARLQSEPGAGSERNHCDDHHYGAGVDCVYAAAAYDSYRDWAGNGQRIGLQRYDHWRGHHLVGRLQQYCGGCLRLCDSLPNG
jgi:hypothetical protein